MHQRPLGSSGLHVGAIAFGCARFAGTDLRTAIARIETALDHGMTLIDTADLYGQGDGRPWGAAETLLGSVLEVRPALRDRMVLATKGSMQFERGRGMGVPYDASARRLREACDASLRRLGTDRIDLYQVHRPDVLAHPAETAGILGELVTSGKVRHIGVSNYSAAQVRALRAHLPSGLDLVTIQPEFSAIHLDAIDDGVLDQAMELGLTPLAWGPLGGGRLVAEPAGDARVEAVQVVLDELGLAHSATRTQVALAFVLYHPAGVIPIIGTGNLERIIESAGASEIVLAKDDSYRIIAAAGRPLP